MQALYEMAFAFNNSSEPFQIYNLIPRHLIPLNLGFENEKSCSLSIVVEEDDEGPDPLTYVDLDQVIMAINVVVMCITMYEYRVWVLLQVKPKTVQKKEVLKISFEKVEDITFAYA